MCYHTVKKSAEKTLKKKKQQVWKPPEENKIRWALEIQVAEAKPPVFCVRAHPLLALCCLKALGHQTWPQQEQIHGDICQKFPSDMDAYQEFMTSLRFTLPVQNGKAYTAIGTLIKWALCGENEDWIQWPWPGSSVGQSVVPIHQGCGFDPRSGHIQGTPNECVNK